MKRVNSELLRVENVVKKDEINADEKFIEMFNHDLIRVIKNYFVLGDLPVHKLEKNNDDLICKICFSAKRIKNFNSIPNV